MKQDETAETTAIAPEERPGVWRRIWSMYYDGFRNMTIGRWLWAIILVKLAILFLVFKLFFFPDILQRDYDTDAERADIDALYELKSRLADLLADPSTDPKDVLNTYARVKTLDVNLANAAARYGDNTEFAAVGYEEVRNSLKDGEVLLDFADFKPKSKPRQYVCYEIRRDSKYPEVHFVCDGARLDSLLALERGRWGNLYTGEAGVDMASIVGEPLSRIIKDAETVYYVPSGVFHKLALEAIPRRFRLGVHLRRPDVWRRHKTACALGAGGGGHLRDVGRRGRHASPHGRQGNERIVHAVGRGSTGYRTSLDPRFPLHASRPESSGLAPGV